MTPNEGQFRSGDDAGENQAVGDYTVGIAISNWKPISRGALTGRCVICIRRRSDERAYRCGEQAIAGLQEKEEIR
jgi:hypothetical protein